jgi:hypothetical protein
MSFDLAVWSQAHRSVKQSSEVYLRLCEEDASLLQPNPQSADDIQYFLDELTQRYPPLSSYTDDTIDESVWMSDFDVSDAHVLLSISFSRVKEVLPFVGNIAYKHNLVCYNPQEGTVLLPRKR